MTLSRNIAYSALILIGGVSIESLQALPPRIAAYAIPLLMLIQAVLSHRAHRFNPDGSPAEKPYDPTGNGMILPRQTEDQPYYRPGSRKGGGDDGFLG